MKKKTGDGPKVIQVNRAPVLTLWAAVVSQRAEYKHAEALTLGKAVAGLNAQAKGRRLGVYEPPKEPRHEKRDAGEDRVALCGRLVPIQKTGDGVRAVGGGKGISPRSVEAYLRRSFGDDLEAVRAAMTALAKSHKPKELEAVAYGLYEQFRPSIPKGKKGWGAKGQLDLGLIRSLATEES